MSPRHLPVVPAQAGTQHLPPRPTVDARLRGHDGAGPVVPAQAGTHDLARRSRLNARRRGTDATCGARA